VQLNIHIVVAVSGQIVIW